MVKLIFLKIHRGSFEEGFDVSLQIAREGYSFSTGIDCQLPKTSADIPGIYKALQTNYLYLRRCFSFRNNQDRLGNRYSSDPEKLKEKCRSSYQQLIQALKSWLSQLERVEFKTLHDRLLNELGESQGKQEEVRFFIQAKDDLLNKLPWHEWSIFSASRAKVEIALSPPNFDRIEKAMLLNDKIPFRILVILGDSEGLNQEQERTILEEGFSGAEVRFIPEPPRQEVSDRLGYENWDILFFTGHSSSENAQGKIYTSPQEYLTIENLKPGLKDAIERGLKLAIFNSCDGLQLAYDLAELHIPQLIVMREPIPDRVAQSFLKHFLRAFYNNPESLYQAVQKARIMLQTEGLEDEFPGASWMPIICQNPAEPSLIWRKPSSREQKNTEDIKQALEQEKAKVASPKKTWKCDRILTGHSDIIKSVAIHPNGNIFASCSLDQTIKIWSLITGEILNTITEHSGGVTCVTFSSDGQTLASSSANPDGTIKLWDTKNWELKRSLKSDDWVVVAIWSIAMSPDAKIIVSGHHADSTVKVWNLETGEVRHTLRGHVWAVHCVAITPDGNTIASGSFDSNIKIWNAHTGRQIYNLNGPGEGPIGWSRSFFSDNSVYTVAFSPDGQTLASGGVKQPIKLWRLGTGEVKSNLTGHTDDVYTIVFSPDGKFLASGSADRTIRIWDLLTGEIAHTLGHSATVSSVAFSPDGQTLVSGSKDRTIKIWHYSP